MPLPQMIGENMRQQILRFLAASILTCLATTGVTRAEMPPANIYKANCDLCHGADGSGDTGPGKAFHAKDLRSDEVRNQTDAALTEVITKGRGKMPAFATKIKPADIQKLVAYIRSLPVKK
jgi:mono/diheme cytochrome c family protein